MSKAGEVERILARYLTEVVERHQLCPWARGARQNRELAIGILWGEPALADWRAGAERALARPGVAVAMVVAPEAACTRAQLGALRDQLAAQLPGHGIAEFHPDAALDLATPARLVPFLRRSPDPMLQLVPLALLDAVRAAPPAAGRAHQAAMLGGHAGPPRPPVGAQIAGANHATVTRAYHDLTATLDAIAADRRAAYARAGISASRSPTSP